MPVQALLQQTRLRAEARVAHAPPTCTADRSPACRSCRPGAGRRRGAVGARRCRSSCRRRWCRRRTDRRGVEVTVLHDPAPSQVRGGVSVSPTQVARRALGPRAVELALAGAVAEAVGPAAGRRRCRCTGWSGVGAVPAATLRAGARAAAQRARLQVPVQALVQQTPCWQKPEAHSDGRGAGGPGRLERAGASVADVGRDAVGVARCRSSCRRWRCRR